MSQVQQTQDLYSQASQVPQTQTPTMPQTQTPTTPQTPGRTGFTIPMHCGLQMLKSDLNKIQIEIKDAAKDAATIAGGVLFNDPPKNTTDKLEALWDRLMAIPISRAITDCDTHKASASQMNTENRTLKAKIEELTRELKEAKETLAAPTGGDAQTDMSQDENNVSNV